MDLILLAGPQAVGKMTVGEALEKRIDAKLLFNHETIDLFARFLGYSKDTFCLSEKIRVELFKAFTENSQSNVTQGIIFTVVVGFDMESDWEVLKQWTSLFFDAGGSIYFIELEADLNERLKRNKGDHRLAKKPSKRNLDFSEKELLESMHTHRLNSVDKEVEEKLPGVQYMKLNTAHLSVDNATDKIVKWLHE